MEYSPPPVADATPIQDEAGWMPAQRPIPETSFLENVRATREEMRFIGNTNAENIQAGEAYGPIIEALEQAGARWGNGRHFLNPASLPDEPTQAYNTRVPGRAEMEQMIFQELARRPGFLPEVPRDHAQFRRQVTQRNAERLQRIRTVQAGGGIGGQLVGGILGSFEDPVNLWTMPFGGSSRTFVGALARAAIENAAVEAISQPFIMGSYAELGEEYGFTDALRNVLFAGGAGAAFRGGAEGVSRGASALAPAYDRLVTEVFEAMPEPLQRRWADAATVDDVLLTDLLRTIAPEETWEPELRAAVNVLERDAEIRDASPFEPGPVGDEAHSTSLAQSLQNIVAGAAPIRVDVPFRSETTVTVNGESRTLRVDTTALPDFERQWAAIIGNEGGTGPRGEFLTSPAGAIGPAQVMPGTAPYAARLAGLPWDDRRYRTDAAYNIALGRAYYQQMLREFNGDPVMAAAAYNAGPGSARTGRGVRGAMARAERAEQPDNWIAYLPRETQGYVRDFQRRAGMAAATRTEPAEIVAAPAGDDARVYELEAELAAREANEGTTFPDEPDLSVPFDAVPTLRRDMFANDNDWAEAQEAIWRRHNDIEAPRLEAPIVRFRRDAAAIEEALPSPREGSTRLWRGNRPSETGRGLNFTNDLPGIALPFREGYGGELSYIDVPTEDLAKYEMTGAAAPGAEVHLPAELAAQAKAVPEADNDQAGPILEGVDDPISALDDIPGVFAERRQAQLMAEESERWSSLYRRAREQRMEQEAASRGNVIFEGREMSPETQRVIELEDKLWRDDRGERTLAEDLAIETELEEARAALRAREGVEAATAASPELARFDDPAGEGIATDSIEHDILADLAADPTLAAKSFLIEGIGEQSLDEILDDLNSDKAAAAALRGCL